jgi:hypothetical protein
MKTIQLDIGDNHSGDISNQQRKSSRGVEKRELKREQWQCYVNSITEHLNPYCKYMLIRTDGAVGGDLRKAHVSGPDLCRYQAQLLTLRAYYKYLLVKTLPGRRLIYTW